MSLDTSLGEPNYEPSDPPIPNGSLESNIDKIDNANSFKREM